MNMKILPVLNVPYNVCRRDVWRLIFRESAYGNFSDFIPLKPCCLGQFMEDVMCILSRKQQQIFTIFIENNLVFWTFEVSDLEASGSQPVMHTWQPSRNCI